jgi:hypothetical protein
MKKKYSVELVILVLLNSINVLRPLTAYELPDIRGFREEALEVYLDRADLETERFAWEHVARYGAEASIASWEKNAWSLYGDGAAEAKRELEAWISGRLEERYEAWLMSRFFERRGAFGAEAVLKAIDEADLEYLYKRGPDGKVLLDEMGDPVLQGQEDAETARTAWRSEIGEAVEAAAAEWEARVDSAFAPELGALLDDDALARYEDYKVSVKAGMRREFERAMLQGELAMNARRLYDQYSLRKKSESETAEAIAASLIRETEASTEAGIAEIRKGLADATPKVEAGEGLIDAERWLASFKAEFERGLDKWEKAEERFLVNRMEWERDAGKVYAEGETAWAAAFEKLRTQRRSWESEIEAILEQGASRWSGLQSELAASIASARSEFQAECQKRSEGTSERVGALVELYAQSLQVAATAKSAGAELLRKLDIRGESGGYAVFDLGAADTLRAWRMKEWESARKRLSLELSGKAARRAEIQGMEDRCKEDFVYFRTIMNELPSLREEAAALDARIAVVSGLLSTMSGYDASDRAKPGFEDALLSYMEYLDSSDEERAAAVASSWEKEKRAGDWLVLMGRYAEQSASAKAELKLALGSAFGTEFEDLRDVLSYDPDSGTAYLDEYQLELLRAKACAEYWAQRKAVAEALVAYAEDITSGRKTEAEGERDFQAAKAAYAARETEYEGALAALRAAGTDLAASEELLAGRQAEAEDAAALYEAARSAYLAALAATQGGSIEYFESTIADRYAQLLEASGLDGESLELGNALSSYYAAARRHGYAEIAEDSWRRSSALVAGDPEEGIESLASLKEAYDTIEVPASVDAIPRTIEELGVAIDSPDFEVVSRLFSAIETASDPDAKRAAGAKLMLFMRHLADEAEVAYLGRLAEIGLLGALSSEDWASDQGIPGSGGDIDSRLAAEREASALGSLAARARAELRGLAAFVAIEEGGAAEDDESLALAAAAPEWLDTAQARSRIASLERLASLAESGPGAVEALKALGRAEPWAAAFLAGQGLFEDEDAGDLAALLASGQARRASLAIALELAWDRSADASPAGSEERESQALAAIAAAFSASGFPGTLSGKLPSAATAAVTIRAWVAEKKTAERLASLRASIEAASDEGPGWVEERVVDYLDRLEAYAATLLARGGLTAAVADEARLAAEASSKAKQEACASLLGSADALSGAGRFGALVDLYGRSELSAALRAELGSLIVEEGGLVAARRSVADPSATLAEIVADMAAPGGLGSAIRARAESLLSRERGEGAEGERLEAFKTWAALAPEEAVASLAVREHAEDLEDLWIEVSSRSFPDAAAREAAIADFLADYAPDDPARALCVALLDEEAAGLEDSGAIYRRYLFGDDFDAYLGELRSLGAASCVYERAAALALAKASGTGALARDLAAFLLARAGLDSMADVASLAGTDFDLDAEAFAGSGDEAREYRYEGLLLEGSASARDLLEGLGAEAASRAAAFSAFLSELRSYIPDLDGSAEDYARENAEKLGEQAALAAALESGSWDAAIFAAISGDSYLDWYGQIAERRFVAGAAFAARRVYEEGLGLSDGAGLDAELAAFWRRGAEAARAVGEDSWRSFLDSDAIDADSRPLVAAGTDYRDSGGYYKANGSVANAILDAFNALADAEGAFAAQLAAPNEGNEILQTYADFLSNYAKGDAQAADYPAATDDDLAIARQNLAALRSRISGLKEDIARAGRSLALLKADASGRQAELELLLAAMNEREAGSKAAIARVDGAVAAFEAAGGAYNGAFASFRGASQRLEDARLAKRTQEEIREWAASAYLAASGETAAGYRSPAERLAETGSRNARADAALAVLTSVYGSGDVAERPIGDEDYLEAYGGWKKSYESYLRLVKVSGDLDDVVAQQRRKVADAAAALDQARVEAVDWQAVLGALGSSWKGSEEAKKKWSGLLVLEGGRLRLRYDASFHLSAQTSEDEWQAVKDYFTEEELKAGDPPESGARSLYSRDFETWSDTFTSIAARFGGASALVDRWGLAADWLRRRLYDANQGDESYKKLLESYSSDDVFMEGDLRNSDADYVDYTDKARKCIDAAVRASELAYESIMADGEERKAFEFYLADQIGGGLAGTVNKQFNSRTRNLATSLFKDYLEEREDKFSTRWKRRLNIIYHYKQKRRETRVFLEKARNILAGIDNGTGSKLGRDLAALDKAEANYEQARVRLAELTGSGGSAMANVADFKAQYRKLEADRRGVSLASVSLDPELATLFSEYFGKLGAADKKSFSAALARMTSLARADRDAARLGSAAAAKTAQNLQDEAQRRYQSAYDAYLNGADNESELRAAARAAFKDAAWIDRTALGMKNELLESAAFSGGGLLNAAEATERSEALRLYAQSILEAFQGALASRGAILENEWKTEIDDLAARRSAWYASVSLMRAKAASSWDAGAEKLRQSRAAWDSGFRREYGAKSEAWDVSYLAFGAEKLEWVDETRTKASRTGDAAILAEVGASADDRMRSASDPLIGSMSYDPSDAQRRLDSLLASIGAEQSLEGSRLLGSYIGQNSGTTRLAFLAADPSGARIANQVRGYLRESRAELDKLAAEAIAADARDSVEEAKKALAENVKSANENFDDSMDGTFLASGFLRKDGKYERDAVVRSTLFNPTKTEMQRVETYRWYALPDLKLSVDLSDERLESLGAGSVMDLVGMAQKEVEDAQKNVFGEGKELTEDEKKAKGLILSFTTRETTDKAGWLAKLLGGKDKVEEEEITRELGEGAFGKHLGYAPEFKKNPDLKGKRSKNIQVEGTGEIGRLMTNYIWYEMQEGQGLSEMRMSWYDKPLWDDRNSFMSAPNLRTVADIGIGIVATVASGGVGAGTLAGMAVGLGVNMADDLVFAGLDLASGNKSWEEVGVSLGKKALASVATSAIGASFNGIQGGTGFFAQGNGLVGLTGKFGENVLGKSLLVGAQSFTTSVTTSAIGAIEWDGNGLDWNNDSFMKGSFGYGAIASTFGGMANTMTAGMLGKMNLRDANGLQLNGRVFDRESIMKFNGLAGGLVDQGIRYSISGDATFNVANYRLFNLDKEKNLIQGGMVELHVGDSGIGMNLGTGGADISIGTIAGSWSGLKDTAKIAKAYVEYAQGDEQGISTFNTVNMLGYTDRGNVELARGIWKGKIEARYQELGENEFGNYNHENPGEIILNAQLLGMGKEKAAKLATVLAHEGTHVQGHREEAVAHAEGLSTYETLKKMFGIENDEGFGATMVAGMVDERNWEANRGSVDPWLLISRSDGTHELKWDNSKDLTTRFMDRDANGDWEEVSSAFLKVGDKTTTRGQSLFQILGTREAMTQAVELAQYSNEIGLIAQYMKLPESQRMEKIGEYLMEKQGMKFVTQADGSGGSWTGDSTFRLTDNRLPSYLMINKKENGEFERFTVSGDLYRQRASWDSALGTGIAPTAENKKALDTLVFTKRDLDNRILDRIVMSGVQSVDVYNGFDDANNVDRHQPYYSKLLGREIEGNTIASNFSMLYNQGDTAHYATIHNAWTLDGDWIGRNGSDGEAGGAWYVHGSSPNQTSDGCPIVPYVETRNYYEQLRQFNIPQYGQIAATLYDSRLFWIKLMGEYGASRR